MSKKRAVRGTRAAARNNVYQLEQALFANGAAMVEGPRKKSWSKHELRHVQAKTPAQREMIYDYMEGYDIFAKGTAGTGKTFIALFLALSDVLDPDTERNRVIIVRSAVPTRNQGFLPGTAEEKAAGYERPYKDVLHDLFKRASTYQDMKESHLIEFETTTDLRGMTWEDAVIVVDECQSMNFHEINTVMTRRGKNSRMIWCGDGAQNDLLHNRHDVTGFPGLVKAVESLQRFSTVTFTRDDIVRHEAVKEWIVACEELGLV